MKKSTIYRVSVCDAGDNFGSDVFNTREEAEAKYNELLSSLEGTEKYHSEDNTNEWLYISLDEVVVDKDCDQDDADYIVSDETIKESDRYYRDALL